MPERELSEPLSHAALLGFPERDVVITMKFLSPLGWVVLLIGVALALLLLTPLSYDAARTVKLLLAIVLGSFLFWLKGRSQRNRR